MNFKIGDTVICMDAFFATSINILNFVGTVIFVSERGIEVEFDNFMGGHDGTDGINKNGHCWYFAGYKEVLMFKIIKTNKKITLDL